MKIASLLLLVCFGCTGCNTFPGFDAKVRTTAGDAELYVPASRQ